jgi:Flp pilus assembly secretin CpaC
MVGDVQDAEYEELQYPSNQAYDFDNIRHQYKVITKEDQQEAIRLKTIEVEELEEVSNDDFKAKLLKRIGERREVNRVKGAQPTQMMLEKKVAEVEAKMKAKRKEDRGE